MRGLKYYREPGSPDRRGRTPRGVRGLKSEISAYSEKAWRRTPRGVRGLKLALSGHVVCVQNVAPLAGCVD